jgi:hypothetical protein
LLVTHEFIVTFTSIKNCLAPFYDGLKGTRNMSIDTHGKQIVRGTIDSLIREHIIICSYYYRHWMEFFQRLISKNTQVFIEVLDFFFIKKFQSEVNEHEHNLLCINYDPIYKQDSMMILFTFHHTKKYKNH